MKGKVFMKRVAINGFGRIGRLAFRLIAEESDIEVVAINDLTSAEELAYYLKYDTNHRSFEVENISFEDNYLIYKDKKIKVYSEKDPSILPWREENIDLVLECTGKFTDAEKAKAHITAGAKKVLISYDIRTFNSVERMGNAFIRQLICKQNPLEYSSIVESITKEDIDNRLREHFDTSTCVLSVVKPVSE